MSNNGSVLEMYENYYSLPFEIIKNKLNSISDYVYSS